jgi:DNA-binding transcriptional regulator YiaG
MVDIPARQTLSKTVTLKKKRYKRKPNRHIDKDDFKSIRQMNCLTIEQTADLLHVTGRTVSSWERGVTRIPYSAFKLLRILANGELLSEAWEGWHIRGDTLYMPTGRAFNPYHLTYLSNYLTMAHYWLAERKQRPIRAQVVSIRPRLRLVIGRSSDSDLPMQNGEK